MSLASYSEIGVERVQLAGPTRAAILLLALGANGASRLLKHFSPDEIRALKQSVADQAPVSAEQIDDLVDDFQEAFKSGPGITGLESEMQKLLRGALSADEMSKVFGDDDFIDPSLFSMPQLSVWEEFERLGVKGLGKMLANEHPQVLAIIVARLQSEIAAGLIATFEPERRNDVMRRMLSAKPLSPDAEAMIEEQLREIFIAGSDSAEKSARRASLAEIANRLDKTHTDEFLASMEQSEPEEAVAIRNLLFAFEDLPKLSKKARLTLFDDVPTETVTMALREAPAELAEVVTSSLAARARRMVEAELARAADVAPADIAAARRMIASLALRLAQEGRISINTKEG